MNSLSGEPVLSSLQLENAFMKKSNGEAYI